MSLAAWQYVSSRDAGHRYRNTERVYKTDWQNIWEITKAYIRAERKAATPKSPVPVRKLSVAELNLAGTGPLIYRLGHSTVLIRLDNQWILTDPVFSKRASPVQWAGPRRFHAPPIELEDLPAIDIVVISHDHYDHLDKASVQALRHKTRLFLTPLGVGRYLREWGIPADRVIELDWWDSRQIGSLNLIATPAQHFSGRGLLDRDRTLWASWVIQGTTQRIFFSGDSGYFGGFKVIGERFGPFDVTLIETGAYHPLWRAIHMLPEESVQAHLDLQGRLMVPIHNSTFDLALHDWYEPMERVMSAARETGIQLALPLMGEALDPGSPGQPVAWWREAGYPADEHLNVALKADARP